jgi:hypothetical protein
MNFTYTHHKVEGADGITDQCIIRTDKNGNEAFIPLDESNSDYQAYLRWLNGDDEASGTLS